jgi:hypothetical protein
MKKRRLVSILLVICMVLNILPVQAFVAAAENKAPAAQQMTETEPINNPFQDV